MLRTHSDPRGETAAFESASVLVLWVLGDEGFLMSPSIIAQCLAALGLPTEGGVSGLCVRTSFDRFDLLQSPDVWGRNPADGSVSRVSEGIPELPPGSRLLLETLEEVVAGAVQLVDIATLEPFASGDFAAAIRRGLDRAAGRSRNLTVRILYGRHRFTSQSDADFEAFILELASGLAAEAGVVIQACRMETSNHPQRPSWNHAKIVAVDGRDAIVGGHNLWHADYFGFAPVHDLSARVDGLAAKEAHNFLDCLWDWVAREAVTPSGTGRLTLIRWAEGRIVPASALVRPSLPEPPPGRTAALVVGRLGTGVLADPRLANIGAAIPVVAFRQATSSIRISQMDFGFHWDGQNYWSSDLVAALADVLTATDRSVEISLVLSEPGAKTAAGGPYSFGTTLEDIVAEMRRVVGGRRLTGRMRLAPLRFSPTGDRWVGQGLDLKIINHAKLWMVDDRVFHIGSDNLYPHNLQEFGYVVESEEVAREVLSAYWEPLWRYSSRVAVNV